MKINFTCMGMGHSGGDRYIQRLANDLVDRGHKVTILHSSYRDLEPFAPLKAEVIKFRSWKTFLVRIRRQKAGYSLMDLLNLLVKKTPDCDVNVATFCWTAYAVEKAGKGRGFYLVQDYETNFFNNFADRNFAEATYHLPLQKLCVSKWLVERLSRKYPYCSKPVYIGNGVEEKFRRFKCYSPKSVLFFARGTMRKNPEVTATAYSLVSQQYHTFLLRGFVSDAELIELYNKSEAVVHLSGEEGFGKIPLEAMGCQCKVVSTPLEYLVDGVNSVVVKSSWEVLPALKRIFHDHDFAKRLISGGLKTVEDYDFAKVVDRFEKAVA